MNIHIIALGLDVFGIAGTTALLVGAVWVAWYYRDSRIGGFRWRWRNWRLKQISALACLFFLAMAASYAVLHEAWAWLYVIGAFKAGTWWLRRAISQGI